MELMEKFHQMSLYPVLFVGGRKIPTKQEEIRKWIEDLGQSAFNLNWNESVYLADTILQHLHEEGVVIKSGKELPSVFDANEDVMPALEYRKKLDWLCRDTD